MSDTGFFVIMFSGSLGLIGIIFLIIGIIMNNNRKKIEMNCTSVTSGKVNDIVKHESRDTDGGYSSS